ncbi:uncharacterized protein FTOL_13903 [Fusarium torulosum]|uniref:Uncharacterized protein n=1 Tax=Fusarium torulosum TaxID=33205 RepID=A0AAE8MMW1_9HYPO|nr:uncharacterized protein FTOL_13903 [Fusarium torulosum]
MLIVLLKKT